MDKSFLQNAFLSSFYLASATFHLKLVLLTVAIVNNDCVSVASLAFIRASSVVFNGLNFNI